LPESYEKLTARRAELDPLAWLAWGLVNLYLYFVSLVARSLSSASFGRHLHGGGATH